MAEDKTSLIIEHNIRDTRKELAGLSKELSGNEQAFNKVNNAAKGAGAGANTLARETKKAGDTVEQQTSRMSGGFVNIRKAMIGIASVAGFISLAKGIVDVTSRYEDLKSTLTTVEQSSVKAARVFDQLNKLAASTPNSVEEWTDSYIKLRNRGLEPTQDELIALGDIAASQGKSLTQFTEAYLDALTGENERLKEFGIQAKKTGDLVTFTFKGIQTTVANTPAAINEVITSFGKMDGVAGGMDARSKTLSGTWSTLKDNAAQLGAGIGNTVLPALKGFVNFTTDAIQAVSQFFGITKDINGQFDELEAGLTVNVHLLQQYNDRLADNNISDKEANAIKGRRNDIIKEINEKYPEYLGNLIDEKTTNEELNKILAKSIDLLRKQRGVKIFQKEANELNERATEIQSEIFKVEENIQKLRDRRGNENAKATAIRVLQEELNRLKALQLPIEKQLEQAIGKRAKAEAAAADTDTQKAVNKRKASEEEAAQLKKQQDEAARAYAASAKEREKAAAAVLKFEEETRKIREDLAATSEIDKLELKHQRELEELAKQRVALGLSDEQTAARRLEIDTAYYQQINAMDVEAAKEAMQRADANRAKEGQAAKEDITDIADQLRAQAEAETIDFLLTVDTKKSFQEIAQEISAFADKTAEYTSQGLNSISQLGQARDAQIQAEFERQKEAQQATLDGTLANIAFLQAAESSATGARKENLQQEISLQQTKATQERAIIAQTEANQKRAQVQAAQREKQFKLFGAVIDTAAAIAKAVASAPFPANIPAIAFASATGAAQLATIAAQPIPKFKQGGMVAPGLLSGPSHSNGGIPIEAEGGEWIFSREKTAAFRPLFEQIQQGNIKPDSLSSANTFGTNATAELRAIRAQLAALQDLKQVNVNMDAKGFRVSEQKANMRTTYISERYAT